MTRLVSSFLAVSAFALAACPSGGGSSPCEDNPDSCGVDAAKPIPCGNGVCEASETPATCPTDCKAPVPCGDGVCAANETHTTCPADCPVPVTCGNSICETGETVQSCAADCAATLVVDNTSSFTLVYFYAWACGTSNTFTNLLTQSLPPNYHVTFTGVTPGCWNIQADTANHAQTAQDLNVTLTAAHTFTWTLHN